MTDDASTTKRLDIDWLRVVGGALAAVASAVVLSTLGAAGTLLGAALGSVVVTVASAVFTQGLSTSGRKLARAQASALHKVGVAQAEVRRAGRAEDTRAQESHLAYAEQRLAQARRELDDATLRTASSAAPGWRERLAHLPWRRIALLSAGLFLVTVVLVTAFELVAGRSVASITGGSGGGDGTTITDLGGGSGGTDQQQPGEGSSESPAPSDSASPSDSPSGSPSPSLSTSPTPTPATSESATPAPSTGTGTPAPTPTPVPSEPAPSATS